MVVSCFREEIPRQVNSKEVVNRELKYPLIIALVAALAFLPFLGHVHLFDWDEVNFAESSREMIITGDYSRVMVGFKPFWEKPPFFFWLQAASMKLFGINEYAARFPNAIFGIITLLTLFYIGKKERNARFGLIWAAMYFASILPHMYFKSGIIDPVFNYFIFTGVYFIYRTLKSSKHRDRLALYAGSLIGLAILTKGPVGLLIPLLSFLVFISVKRFKILPKLREVVLLAVAAAIVSFAWYGFELFRNGPWFLVEFIKYQVQLFTQPVADHQQPIYYHFVVVLLGCFPMSVYALTSFQKKHVKDDFTRWMMILFWVVMILFTIVTTKIVHYSSLAYLPLSYLAALLFYRAYYKGTKMMLWVKGVYLFIGLLFGVLLTALPLVYLYRENLVPYIDDPFAVAGLMKSVAWNGYEFLFGFAYLLAVVISFLYIRGHHLKKALISMVIGTSFLLSGYMVFVLPKIESHTQGSLVNFLIEHKDDNAYVWAYGFYTYASYYYFEQPNDNIERRENPNFLLNGPIDKPVYIITKVTNKTISEENYPDLRLLKEEGGYRFFIREVPSIMLFRHSSPVN